MSIFKKRSVAFTIAVVAVILFSLIGIHRSAGAKAQAVLDEFSTGKESISSQLENRASAAMRIYSTYNTHYKNENSKLDSAGQSLLEKRNTLKELLDSGAGATNLYAANKELTNAAESCYEQLRSLSGISQEHLSNLEGDYKTMLNAQAVIENSSYNNSVLAYNEKVLASFPLTLFKSPGIPGISIETPELFA